jgi:uroporphyrinogen III methyltransferase/synthase
MANDSSAKAPLNNKLVFLGCSEKTSHSLSNGLQAMGAEVTLLPLISIRAMEDHSELDAALHRLHEYSWIIFTSSHGVDFFLHRLHDLGVSKQKINKLNICAVGPSTAARLSNAGIHVALVPEQYVAEGAADALARHHGSLSALTGLRILMPRAKEARDALPDKLRAAGALVDIAVCYQNVLPERDEQLIRLVLSRDPDLLVFTSSSAVHNFHTLLGKKEAGRFLHGSIVAAIGTVTAETAASYGKTVEILPEEFTVASLLEAIRTYFREVVE